MQHAKVINELRNINVVLNRYIELIRHIIYTQTVVIRVANPHREIEIQEDVRLFSPPLFNVNVYSQLIFQEARWKMIEVGNISGVIISNIRLPDDTAIMTESSEKLQNGTHNSQYKTKYMIRYKKKQ